jgi:hypothetical protein
MGWNVVKALIRVEFPVEATPPTVPADTNVKERIDAIVASGCTNKGYTYEEVTGVGFCVIGYELGEQV